MLWRISKVMTDAGVHTFEESNSLTGMFKHALRGLQNLQAGAEAAMVMVELYSTDYDAMSRRVDARYTPQVQARVASLAEAARVEKNAAYWFVLSGVAVLMLAGLVRQRQQLT